MTPRDRIIIHQIQTNALIGVYPDEHHTPQPVGIDVELLTSLRQAGESDSLTDTINYADVEREIVSIVHEKHYHLIEALAERIATDCLTHYPIDGIVVRIHKPQAPKYAKSVAVEITRFNHEKE